MTRQRFLVTALVASVLCNAVLIGYGVSQWLDRSAESSRAGLLHAVGQRLTHNLDPESYETVASALDRLDPAYRSSLVERREDYRRLRALLAEEEIDREAIDTVLTGMRDRSAELVYIVNAGAIDAIVALPPDKRIAIADDD